MRTRSFLLTAIVLGASVAAPAIARAAPGAVPTAEITPASTPAPGFTNVRAVVEAPLAAGVAAKVSFHVGDVRLNGASKTSSDGPQQLTMAVPAALQGSRLAHIELRHSQNLAEKSTAWSGKKTERDETGGYSQVEVYVEGKGWTNLGQPKKFAEARQEVERLHDLPDAKGKITSVRVRSVGVDPVHVHDVTLHFLPQRPDRFDEMRFTPTTSFGDAWHDVTPRTPRDRAIAVPGTRYPGGVCLNNDGRWAATSPETMTRIAERGWSVDRDSLSIPLEAGRAVRSVEVAIGDTQPDAAKNGDGSYGRKGWAKLQMVIERRGGGRLELTNGENIPSEGLMVASPDYVAEPGDRLRIRVTQDVAGLMGVRLGYGDVGTEK